MDEPDSYLTALQFSGSFFAGSVLPAGVFLKLLAVAALVVANAFFVASEFALVSVRRTRLEERAQGGSRGAQASLRLLDNPTLLISATQLGVTLASLALGWAGEPTIAALLEPIAEKFTSGASAIYVAHIIAIVIAFTVITFLHIVLGELMPKMVALERAEPVALFCARPLELFARVFSPPLWIFNKAGTVLGRLLGLKSSLDHTSVYARRQSCGNWLTFPVRAATCAPKSVA
jgi:CBS domain containing-hemolysin-like protein